MSIDTYDIYQPVPLDEPYSMPDVTSPYDPTAPLYPSGAYQPTSYYEAQPSAPPLPDASSSPHPPHPERYEPSPVSHALVPPSAPPDTPLHATAQSWSEMDGHVLYLVEAHLPSGGKCAVELRYSQAHALRQWLASFPRFSPPPLPGLLFQGLFSSAASQASRRLPALQAFLSWLSSRPELLAFYEVQDLLGLSPHLLPRASPALVHPAGLLYLKLFQAYNLPHGKDDGTMPSVYPELALAHSLARPDGDQRVPTVSCDAFSPSLDPIWFAEFVFFLPATDRPRPLMICLKRTRRISANIPLNYVHLHPYYLQPGTLYELMQPLKPVYLSENHPSSSSSSSSTTTTTTSQFDLHSPSSSSNTPSSSSNSTMIVEQIPTLRLSAHFLPCQIPKPTALQLPFFRLQFHQRTSFFPAQPVTGFVIANIGKPIQTRKIDVQLVGLQRTHWEEHHTEHYTDSDGNHRTRTRTEHRGSTATLIHTTTILWTPELSSPASPSLASGSYTWPFQFWLPERLPPTFACSAGEVEYVVKARIARGAFKFDDRVSATIRVLAPFTSPDPLPRVYGFVDRVPFRSADQVVNLRANMNHDIVILGENALMTLHVENLTAYAIRHARFKLVGKVVARETSGHSHSTSVCSDLLHLTEGFPIAPGDSRAFSVLLAIPKNAQPTLPRDLSPLITVEHAVVVTCKISGFLTGSAKASVPVIVSHRYQMKPPPRHKPEKALTVERIQRYGIGLPQYSTSVFTPLPNASSIDPTLYQESNPEFPQTPLLNMPTVY